MRLLGNILWHFPCFGFVTSLFSFLAGILLTVTVVGAPIGLGLIQYAKFALAPYSYSMIDKRELHPNKSGNILYAILCLIVRILYFPLGVLFFLISMILIVFIIGRTLLFGDPVAGWPSMACILFLVSGVQLFCTGIVGIYLSKTYLETKHRPIYLLKETSEETVKMHSVQPVKKQESAAKRRKDAHTAEKKNVYFPEYADKRHASERGEIRA